MTFPETLLTEYLLVLVRVSTCLMILPGFSSIQIAMRIRMFVAAGISISVFLLVQDLLVISNPLSIAQLVKYIAIEIAVALVFAIPIRFIFLALSFLGEITTQMIGLNPIPGTPIADDQSSTVLSGLFNITAIVLFFSTGLHLSFIVALANSFTIFPPGQLLSISAFVETTANNLDEFFNIAVRLGAPIFVYAIILNLIAGLVNKLTPQIPVYFVSTPFLICGGLVFTNLGW